MTDLFILHPSSFILPMRRWLEAFEEFAIDVILERRYGKRARSPCAGFCTG